MSQPYLTREERAARREARLAEARKRQRRIDLRDNVLLTILFGSLGLMALTIAVSLVAILAGFAVWLWQVVL